MNLREKIGALICPRVLGDREGGEAFDFPDAEQFLREYPPGSFIVMGGTIEKTPQLLAAIAARLPRPPLFAADVEEGLGQQLRGARRIAPMMALGAAARNLEARDSANGARRGLDLARRLGRAIACDAAAAGIRWIFAPVLDIARDPRNPVIGSRALGADPEKVATLGIAFCEGVAQGGGIATAKHFPGHGSTPVDSHESLPTVDLSWERFEREDLTPFAAAIRAGMPSIMAGHLAIPALDPTPGLPASLSRVALHDLLRKKLGFRGAVVTDALVMGGVKGSFPEDDLALLALHAGSDVLLMPVRPLPAARRIEAAIRCGELPEARLDEAFSRIESLRTLASSKIPTDRDETLASDLATAAISITRPRNNGKEKPVAPANTLALTICNETKDREDLPIRFRQAMQHAGFQEADNGRPVLVVFADNRAWRGRAGLSPESIATVERAIASTCNPIARDPILLAFCSPFVVEPWSQRIPTVLAYGASDSLIEAALDRLKGDESLA